MKKIAFIFLFIAKITLGQTVPKAYSVFIKQADSLRKIKEYKNSAFAYDQAFSANGRKAFPNDRYNAAGSWAMAGYPDSAFYQLTKIATRSNFSDYTYITSDANLTSLHKDPRWPELLKTIKENKDKTEGKYNHKLIELIDSMRTADQKWRGLLRQLANNEADSILYPLSLVNKNTRLTDSLNYYGCKKILNQYGYPNYELVGTEASHNFWLLIQHQDHRIAFQDSVLKKMKPEVDKGQASGTDYAYLTDRVKVNTGELQVYGTQMILNKDKSSYEPQPTMEPEKLNERRKSVGLQTEEEYIKTMNTRYFGTLKK